jgi:hypothetical protein
MKFIITFKYNCIYNVNLLLYVLTCQNIDKIYDIIFKHKLYMVLAISSQNLKLKIILNVEKQKGQILLRG